MNDKNAAMQDFFQKLNERNKDILILIAKSMQVAQEEEKTEIFHQKPYEP